MGKIEEEILNVVEVTPVDTIATLEIELQKLEEAYGRLEKENQLNKDALALLITKCKLGNFNPFADEGIILVKHPSEMTEEELIIRNKKVTEKFAKNRASSDEVAPFPTSEEMNAQYKDREDKGYKEAVNSVLKHTVKRWIGELEEDAKKGEENV